MKEWDELTKKEQKALTKFIDEIVEIIADFIEPLIEALSLFFEDIAKVIINDNLE